MCPDPAAIRSLAAHRGWMTKRGIDWRALEAKPRPLMGGLCSRAERADSMGGRERQRAMADEVGYSIAELARLLDTPRTSGTEWGDFPQSPDSKSLDLQSDGPPDTMYEWQRRISST